MKVHPREKIYGKASMRLNDLLSELRKELTWGEFLRLISQVASSEWLSISKYQIREERHPDEPDKPGSVE